VKDSNKKKKNKQKGKKNLSQNNEINENTTDNNTQNNNIIIQNIEDDKTDLSTDKATSANTKEEEDKIIQNEIINENNENITEKEKEKDKFKKENHKEYDYNSSKHKNKFNMSINQKQFKKENYKIPSKKYHHHDSNYNYNYNYKYKKNDYNEAQNNYIEQEPNSEQNNYLMGSNLPHFTSFNFQSKKKRNYRNKQQGNNENIFPYNNFMQQNIIKLSKEIYDNTIKVNENKKLLQQIREKYIKKIYENINIILKNSKVEFQCSFYGSSVSGLAIENSDIDIMVKLRKKYEEKDYIIRIMNILVENLKKSDLKYIKVINPITSASVPVIKLNCDLLGENSFNEEMNSLKQNNYLNIYNSSKLYFDITFFETENELEKIPSELMLDYIKECTMLYPQIFDIVYIMKRFLYNRKLNKSYQGGISSYSLFLLTLAFIKSYKSKYDIPIASLFIEYLYFYSNFNFFNTIIQPSKENNIFEKKEYDPRNQCLDIIDPITGLNVAKSTFRIEEIQSAFRNGFDNIIFHLVDLNMDMNMDNIGNINNNINIQEQSKRILEKFFTLSQ
jgi:DNA polymerase sigma